MVLRIRYTKYDTFRLIFETYLLFGPHMDLYQSLIDCRTETRNYGIPCLAFISSCLRITDENLLFEIDPIDKSPLCGMLPLLLKELISIFYLLTIHWRYFCCASICCLLLVSVSVLYLPSVCADYLTFCRRINVLKIDENRCKQTEIN